MPKVSVIMPVFNKELYLRRSIESVLNQTYTNFDFIIINDGSTDSSSIIVQDYERKDFRIKYINQTNHGVSNARNKGLDMSESEFIAFLDADDELRNDFLEKMIESILGDNVCYCGHYFVLNDYKKEAKINFLSGDILVSYLLNSCTPNTNSWLIRKSFLNDYNIRFTPNISWGEDMLFFSKVLLHEKSVRCTKLSLTKYYLNQANCLSENSLDKIDKDIFWMDEVKQYVLLHEFNEKRKRGILRAIDSYRKPASIVYRINSNLNQIKPEDLISLIKVNFNIIRKFKFINKGRSVKLLIVFIKIFLRYIIKHKKGVFNFED